MKKNLKESTTCRWLGVSILIFLYTLIDALLQGPLFQWSRTAFFPVYESITPLITFLTALSGTVVVLIVTLIALFFLIKQKRWDDALLFVLALAVGEVIKTGLKLIIALPRPTTMLIAETGFTFPSGHATFAILFWGLIFFFFWKKGMWLLLLAPLLALTRIYLHVHWVNDIIAGLALGGIILTGTMLLSRLPQYHQFVRKAVPWCR